MMLEVAGEDHTKVCACSEPIMTNEEVLRELASTDRMVGLVDEVRRYEGAESPCIAYMLEGCVQKGRKRIKATVPPARLELKASPRGVVSGAPQRGHSLSSARWPRSPQWQAAHCWTKVPSR